MRKRRSCPRKFESAASASLEENSGSAKEVLRNYKTKNINFDEENDDEYQPRQIYKSNTVDNEQL